MTFLEEFSQAVRHQRLLMKHRPDRARFRFLIYAIWATVFGVAFAVAAGLQQGYLGTPRWWQEQLPANMLISSCVMLCFFIVFRSFEKLAPQRWLDRIMGWRDWRSAVFFSTLSIGCSLAGIVIGLMLVDVFWTVPKLRDLLGSFGFWRQFLLISLVISVLMTWRYRARLKQQLMQARINEAQLRLLQGQIEPHFLFNTLANVQSLIDFDPGRAKLMLERFTDYLRASLAQMRGESTTLAQEFAMLEAYLGLMQLRMGQRLQLAMSLPAELAQVPLPPLLVQPLVENAIHHGLEPQVAGGTVSVSARQVDGRLWIEVADDGQGLDGPRRRAGNGVALANIRERLAARFGPSSRLDLLPRDGGGTLARIQFPLPTDQPQP